MLSLLKASSMYGIFIRDFYEPAADRSWYLERWVYNRSCIAAGHLDVRDAVGIVSTKRGVAIRVLAAHYDSAVEMLHLND